MHWPEGFSPALLYRCLFNCRFLFVLGLTPLAIGAAIVSRRGGLLLASLLVLGVLVGMARGALPDTNATAVPVGNLAGNELILSGVVRDAPSRRGQLTRLRVRLESARAIGATDDDGIDLAGDAIAWIYPPSFSLGAGDRVTLTGRVQRPVPDDDELPFSQGEQSPAQDSYSNNLVILTRPDIRLVNRAPLPMTWLNSLRDSLSGSLQRSLPSPQAELARALLLGQRDDLPAELSEQWRRAGTAHLLAISGLHVSVVLGVALISGNYAASRPKTQRSCSYCRLPSFGHTPPFRGLIRLSFARQSWAAFTWARLPQADSPVAAWP